MDSFYNKLKESGAGRIAITAITNVIDDQKLTDASKDDLEWEYAHQHLRRLIPDLLFSQFIETNKYLYGRLRRYSHTEFRIGSQWSLDKQYGVQKGGGTVSIYLDENPILEFEILEIYSDRGSKVFQIIGHIAALAGILSYGAMTIGPESTKFSTAIKYTEKIGTTTCSTRAELSFNKNEYVDTLYKEILDFTVPETYEEAYSWKSKSKSEDVCFIQALLNHPTIRDKTGLRPLDVDGIFGPKTQTSFNTYREEVLGHRGGGSAQEALKELVNTVKSSNGWAYWFFVTHRLN